MKSTLLGLALLSCLLPQEERVGTSEQKVHYKIATKYNQPEAVDSTLEASARSAGSFGPRYAAMLVRIHRTFAKGNGYKDLYLSLQQDTLGGAPKGASLHCAALAAGLKKAIYCAKCENGKIKCPHCQGKKKFDMKCLNCDGKGYIHAKGEVKPTVLQRCNSCSAVGFIKDCVCDICSVTGYVDCPDCKGTPWREEACPSPECRSGKVTCAHCKGKGTAKETCPDCGGKKRTIASGASSAFKVSVKCRACDGEGFTKVDCPKCNKMGKIICETCKGKPEFMKVVASLTDVLGTNPCNACGGQGWPEAGKAIACPRCFGLGVLVIPTADGTKILVPE